MMEVIERIEGHYEAREVEFGTVYRWYPECVVVECDCGEMVALSESKTTCLWCEAEHGAIVRRTLTARKLEEETQHPWRYAGDGQGAELPC